MDHSRSFAELASAVDDSRARILVCRDTLRRYFVGKDDVIDAMIVCAAAGEPLLLVGEPGTAKSDLIVKFVEAASVPLDSYFEYMLTKFTEPNEILGPIDINRLKEGEYIRRTAGKLPEARVAFLDEIFKSNSAILNTLLTILNERKFYQNGVPTPVPLAVLFAATNDVPDLAELAALKDRFTLKVPCESVRDTHYSELVSAGLRNEIYRTYNERPWAGACELDDFLIVKEYLERTMAGLTDDDAADADADAPDDPIAADRRLSFPEGVFLQFTNLLRTLEKEDGVPVTDRKVIKLYKLIRTHAYLMHGGEVQPADLALVRYAVDDPHDYPRVAEKVRALLSLRTGTGPS